MNSETHVSDEDEEGAPATEGGDEGDLSLRSGTGPVQMNKNDRSIAEYFRWYKEKRVVLDPDWQRGYLWDKGRASKLIESILMQIPIPVIYLAENENHDYEVIDGVQRLTSLFKFIDNEIELKGLEYLKELNGRKFENLDRRLQNVLRDSTIRAFELASSTDKDMLFLIFERLNTGGVRLNEMEIRNCIYRGALNDTVKRLADNKDFLQCVNTRNLSKRMDDRSLVLRFLAFYQMTYAKATNGLKNFLNEFCETYRNPPENKLREFERKFSHAMKAGHTVFGSSGFRLRRTGPKGGGEWAPRINQTVFQVVSVSFAEYDLSAITRRSDAILEEYVAIQFDDQQWMDSVTKSTGDAASISYSFRTWSDRLREVMSVAVANDNKRAFSKALKAEMFRDNPTCRLCGSEIKTMNDAAMDHEEHYWRGGKTVPDNARLVHRHCNLTRPRT